MADMTVYWTRIVNGSAIPISLVGMAIVFLSLMVISIFIRLMPPALRLLGLVSDTDEAQTGSKAHTPDDHVVAAIGAVLLHRLKGKE